MNWPKGTASRLSTLAKKLRDIHAPMPKETVMADEEPSSESRNRQGKRSSGDAGFRAGRHNAQSTFRRR